MSTNISQNSAQNSAHHYAKNPYGGAMPELRLAIAKAYREDETASVNKLSLIAELPADALIRVRSKAEQLVKLVRQRRVGKGGLDSFLFEYKLSSNEGIALLCLAEALLRIPDSYTADWLIKDKITTADWEQHAGKSASTFVNAATWALMLTGKIVAGEEVSSKNMLSSIKSLLKRGGEHLVRQAAQQAMGILAKQFVMGTNMARAIKRAVSYEAKGFRYSYDMLGEAARTAKDAENYFARYKAAILALDNRSNKLDPITGPGISVKLSALHPRFEPTKRQRVIAELYPLIKSLALLAKQQNIGLTIDAEEAERLDLTLDLLELLIKDAELVGWLGLGYVVQAYQKRAPYVLDWLIALARQYQRKLMLRLVKGAYWDSEIKWAQERGLSGYPVFTRKVATDVCYHACMHKMFKATDVIYPQFATHNAYTVAMALELANKYDYYDFEFQCLHGMGDALYLPTVGTANLPVPCRIYAPVGGYEYLLAYLVRRLLENGANTSFVNRIVDEKLSIEELTFDPVEKIKQLTQIPHPQIQLPRDIYTQSSLNRINSLGVDLSNPLEVSPILTALQYPEVLQQTAVQQPASTAQLAKSSAPSVESVKFLAAPTVKTTENLIEKIIYQPADRSRNVGIVKEANSKVVEQALQGADSAAIKWQQTTVERRVTLIEVAANILEQERNEFIALIVREGGRTIADAISEVREAVDFCRYYAQIARKDFVAQQLLGYTGEYNQITLHGRGIIFCISPWNFPLAIFTGQVVAALLAGNSVIAKPASQTPLVAAKMVEVLHRAGVPELVVQLLPGSGGKIGNLLVSDTRIKGVMLTGSTDTARGINQLLSTRPGAIVPFIAETGGQNAMIVDSSALPEQVVADVLLSAFGSAGQRCSSLRVLFLQEDVADAIIEMLVGAMQELRVGEPANIDTDVGPIIDQGSLAALTEHCIKLDKLATLLAKTPLPTNLAQAGTYFAPRAYEINSIKVLTGEVFGPILHVVRYKAKELTQVIADINNTGYGLTLGVHSRIDEMVDFISQRVNVGNVYINRNMIGAVVGVQPFGGEGLSGTGPKAGGPRYLHRLATERTLSINTAATGGNASLVLLQE